MMKKILRRKRKHITQTGRNSCFHNLIIFVYAQETPLEIISKLTENREKKSQRKKYKSMRQRLHKHMQLEEISQKHTSNNDEKTTKKEAKTATTTTIQKGRRQFVVWFSLDLYRVVSKCMCVLREPVHNIKYLYANLAIHIFNEETENAQEIYV